MQQPVVVCVLALAGGAQAQVTERVSVDWNGQQAPDGGDLAGSSSNAISADGRYVIFTSYSPLVFGDTNATWDVFLRDRLSGTTEIVSVDSAGVEGNGFSSLYGMSISSDGRFVAFESRANNLVPGDNNGASDIFVRDRTLGTTERISVGNGGVEANGASEYPSFSADARFVVFTSKASNLVAGDVNGAFDVFVHDRAIGTTELMSTSSNGANGNLDSYVPAISADGRYVAFESDASNLAPGDTNGTWDVFVHDRVSGSTERVSVTSGGAQANADSVHASISADGRFVCFDSGASNLVSGDTDPAPENRSSALITLRVEHPRSVTCERANSVTSRSSGS